MSAGARKACTTSVTIAGQRVCLAVGKPCKRTYESKYMSKGFTCKKNSSGSYRLKRVKQEF